MILKRKSLVVALISSFIISAVLVLTLVGYVAYIELKGEEFKRSYEGLLKKVNAKVYAKKIEVTKLNAEISGSGALKGKPVIEGVIKNSGPRNITSLLMKVKFLDRDGAIIYEAIFQPQEPSLGTSVLAQIPIPRLSGPPKIMMRPNESFPFKRVLTNCPVEIADELEKGGGGAKNAGRWSGKFTYEILEVDF